MYRIEHWFDSCFSPSYKTSKMIQCSSCFVVYIMLHTLDINKQFVTRTYMLSDFTCYLSIINRNRKTNNVVSTESSYWIDILRRVGNMRDEMNYNAAAATRVIFVWTKNVSSEAMDGGGKIQKLLTQKMKTRPCVN